MLPSIVIGISVHIVLKYRCFFIVCFFLNYIRLRSRSPKAHSLVTYPGRFIFVTITTKNHTSFNQRQHWWLWNLWTLACFAFLFSLATSRCLPAQAAGAFSLQTNTLCTILYFFRKHFLHVVQVQAQQCISAEYIMSPVIEILFSCPLSMAFI